MYCSRLFYKFTKFSGTAKKFLTILSRCYYIFTGFCARHSMIYELKKGRKIIRQLADTRQKGVGELLGSISQLADYPT